MLGFCDEVVVVDAGSSDETLELLNEIARTDTRLRIIREYVDFSHPRWGIHLSTSLKARARLLCRGEYLWEMDTDEVIGPQEYGKIEGLLSLLELSKDTTPTLALPTAHLWGDVSILRTDIPVWRTRLSLNDPRITHGLRSNSKKNDELGNSYLELQHDPAIECSSTYTWLDLESELSVTLPNKFSAISNGLISSLPDYFNALTELPVILNLGTLNIPRALQLCASFLPGYYTSIFRDYNFDSTQWNPIFKKPWIAVTNDEICSAAEILKEGGPTQFIRDSLSQELKSFTTHQIQIPQSVKDWAREVYDREWSNSLAVSGESAPKREEGSTDKNTATLASEFSSLAGEFTEVHNLEVILPPHQSSGKYSEQIPIIHRTIPVDIGGLLELTHKAFEGGNIEEGRRYLSYAENIAPKDAHVIMTRIDFLLSLNESEDAIVYAKRGLWLFPTRAEFRKIYQECLAQRG